MAHRTKSKDRCPRCRIRRVLCLCPVIPSFDLQTRLVVLIHNRETKRPTNTGRLATLALHNSEIRIRGKKDAQMSSNGIITDDRQALLLYPDDDAHLLTRELAQSFKKPITLIVPDGSWRQAAKVSWREPVLLNIPRVKLPPGPPTEYRLRRETKENGLATFEAISRAMGILEGEAIQNELDILFKTLVERTLWSRGFLRYEDCVTGIPDGALQEGERLRRCALKI